MSRLEVPTLMMYVRSLGHEQLQRRLRVEERRCPLHGRIVVAVLGFQIGTGKDEVRNHAKRRLSIVERQRVRTNVNQRCSTMRIPGIGVTVLGEYKLGNLRVTRPTTVV